MLKLYRKIRGQVLYWEAWGDQNQLVVHWGVVGNRGEIRQLALQGKVEINSRIEQEARPWRAKGYKEIKNFVLNRVVVQYKIRGHGNTSDHDKRVRVENLINESLGWTG